MAFTQPCFIRKNTPELRRKLEELGYKKGVSPLPVGQEDIYDRDIHLFENKYHFRTYTCYGVKNNIDCGTNEELFLALAALRDDSDYMQWFVFPKTHTKKLSGCFGQVVGMDGHYQEIVGYEWHRYENKDNALTERLNTMIQMEGEDIGFLPHKATVKEIIEHFK